MKMKADVVIVGTGAAGLFAALNLSRNRKIIMITKADAESSDSFLAQGGICVLRNEEDYDSYFEDTMRAGHYENRQESVDIMIRGSQDIIRDLIAYGVTFQKEEEQEGENGQGAFVKSGEEDRAPLLKGYAFTREGAHSKPRILFHEDVTGKEITSTLLARVKELENVTIYEYTTMKDIIEENGQCVGILAEGPEGQPMELRADYTIFACGGIGGRYSHSTNFPHITGDAIEVSKNTASDWNIWIMYSFIRPRCIQLNQDGDF